MFSVLLGTVIRWLCLRGPPPCGCRQRV